MLLLVPGVGVASFASVAVATAALGVALVTMADHWLL